MNAYNPLASMQRLEAAGLPRKQAEAIASEITDGTNDLVTNAMLEAALDKVTLRLSVIIGGMLALVCTILGTLMAILASH
ncbi:MAG: hypothetical protein ABIM50_15670 [Novosphingobium sp.]